MTPIQQRAQCGGKEILLETGKIAKQADGAVWVRTGDSVVLVTVVSAKEKKEGIDFFPLTVDYQEKMFAAGRIPGSFFRREGRPTEKETLVSRMVDRSCRPLFTEGYANETQIIATVVSFDQENDTDVLALTGASAALQLSDIPFNGPIAGVRVCRVDGQFVANPTLAQREGADLDDRDGGLGRRHRHGGGRRAGGSGGGHDRRPPLRPGGREGPAGRAARARRGASARRRSAASTRPRTTWPLRERVKALTWEKVKEAYGRDEKHDRYGRLSEVKKELLQALKEEAGGDAAKLAELSAREKEIKGYYEDVKYEYMRKMITDERRRIGGRGERDIRKITCEVGLLPRVARLGALHPR